MKRRCSHAARTLLPPPSLLCLAELPDRRIPPCYDHPPSHPGVDLHKATRYELTLSMRIGEKEEKACPYTRELRCFVRRRNARSSCTARADGCSRGALSRALR